jgi:hypothetical protein
MKAKSDQEALQEKCELISKQNTAFRQSLNDLKLEQEKDLKALQEVQKELKENLETQLKQNQEDEQKLSE